MLRLSLIVLLLAGTSGIAAAHAEYQREFQKLYAKRPGVDKDFRKLVIKAKCNACHQGKEDRTNYNRYGEALTAHLVDGDKKDKAKILAALETVAGEYSADPGSPTFGELIERGELPGGPLEESKKEPESLAP